MTIFIATLLTFLIAFFALSVGMIFGDIKLRGHCGSPSLDGGCCDSDPQQLELPQLTGERDKCVIDGLGNKIHPCSTCDCDD